MENVDITDRVKLFIKFGLISLIILSSVIGYAVFHHYHAAKNFRIDNAKVTGTMVSVRALANGKIKELTFKDGDTVQAGDVIAKVEVSVTPEQIQQLEEAVNAAKQNYENLKGGQKVKVAVKKTKIVTPPAANPSTSPAAEKRNPGVKQPVPATIEALAERARRMEELFDMGAVSATQRDAAKKSYEDALKNGLPAATAPQTGTGTGLQTVEEIEYVDQWQPTPPAVLATAESAIKQAELALNVAKQEAQQTSITAPFSGIIYYSAAIDGEIAAGEVVAKVGNSKELWLEAEVDEELFEKIPIGKKVTYQIDGKNFEGTLIEKIYPTKPEEVVVEEVAEETPKENPEEAKIDVEVENKPADEIKHTSTETEEPIIENYILKFSIPAESDIEIKPNMTTSINFSMRNIF